MPPPTAARRRGSQPLVVQLLLRKRLDEPGWLRADVSFRRLGKSAVWRVWPVDGARRRLLIVTGEQSFEAGSRHERPLSPHDLLNRMDAATCEARSSYSRPREGGRGRPQRWGATHCQIDTKRRHAVQGFGRPMQLARPASARAASARAASPRRVQTPTKADAERAKVAAERLAAAQALKDERLARERQLEQRQQERARSAHHAASVLRANTTAALTAQRAEVRQLRRSARPT